jgi:pantoate--beta-alanine ligase
MPIEIIGVPTVREPDGLAMSSRNVYLGTTERAIARLLYRELTSVADTVRHGRTSCSAAVSDAAKALLGAGFDKVEYLTVVDAESLRPVDRVTGPARVVAAVRLGRTRLIDNIGVG